MQGYTPEVRNPSERIMYHLFASLGFGSNYDGPQLFDPSTYVGFLYRASPRGSDVVSGAWIIASHNNASHTHIYIHVNVYYIYNCNYNIYIYINNKYSRI